MSCVLVTLQRSIHALLQAEQKFAPHLGSGKALVSQEMASLGVPFIAAASSPGLSEWRAVRQVACAPSDSMLSLRKKEGCGLASQVRGHGLLAYTSELVLS